MVGDEPVGKAACPPARVRPREGSVGEGRVSSAARWVGFVPDSFARGNAVPTWAAAAPRPSVTQPEHTRRYHRRRPPARRPPRGRRTGGRGEASSPEARPDPRRLGATRSAPWTDSEAAPRAPATRDSETEVTVTADSAPGRQAAATRQRGQPKVKDTRPVAGPTPGRASRASDRRPRSCHPTRRRASSLGLERPAVGVDGFGVGLVGLDHEQVHTERRRRRRSHRLHLGSNRLGALVAGGRNPRPPAPETAAARAGVEGPPAMGAPITGTLSSRRSSTPTTLPTGQATVPRPHGRHGDGAR